MVEQRIGYISIAQDANGNNKILIDIDGQKHEVENNTNGPLHDIAETIDRLLKEDIKYKVLSVAEMTKLKRSKMFIDKKIYAKICKQFNRNVEDHLKSMANPTAIDLDIMLQVYQRITKIIR